MKNISVGDFSIGLKSRPFIIAEMSGNHNQSLDRAYRIIDAAISAGAHAIKLQTASPDGLTLNIDSPDFQILDKESLWYGKNLYQLYEIAITPWDWHAPIFEYCQKKGIIVFSSPFELKAVDFLEELDAPLYKIASFELVDTQLLRRVAKTGKPVILSTGMATLSEIETAVNTVRDQGNDQIVLLKCTSTYPAKPSDTNLLTIPHLRDAFKTIVGLSDHTMGVGASCAAVAMGATVIEKHFTLARADGGVDSAFSLEPHELKILVEETERAWQALGAVEYGGSKNERNSLKFRRSIYVSRDMVAGEVLTENNIRVIRPGFGLAPKYYEIVLGRRVNQDLKKGTAFSWNYIG
ncbi:pseudaminic acid synthase [Pseudothauera nasutitermitis]|uniref:Pseudaminic acid synthase n=1 Tax=Pseudothauera nasutitermitis TaxID=2565930 RepID=A0A4V6RX61_9RHOO|nr:pseudaminic acid synthase [Pseudothauera nasutitermitis]THF63119.1 pseudaminic acid synthase [Pseudothauera nasutitermitis]